MPWNKGNSKNSDADIPNMGFKLDYVQPVAHNGMKIQCIEASNIQVELTFWKFFIICFVLGANPPIKGDGGNL